MNIVRVLSLIIFALFLSACAGTFKSKVHFNPTEPIRVAVLPFAQVNDKGEVIEPDPSFLIDRVSVVSSKLKDTPAQFVRKLVQEQLTQSGLDVISPALIHAKLSHQGFARESDLALDVPKIQQLQAQEVCSKLLACDAVLYGKVTNWSRTYLAIQSISTAGISLRLVSAKDGKVLYESEAKDSDSRGITKGPTGFSNLVIEPLRGLDNAILTDLAREVVKKAVAPLRVENRPEYLQSSPPAIFASAHDALDGKLSKKGHLTVVALGSSKMNASFSVGNAIENVPMVERDDGQYVGEFYPLPTDTCSNCAVAVQLSDNYGRTTSQTLGKTSVTIQ